MSTNSGGYNIFLRGRKGNIDKESQFIQGGRLSASSAEYKHVTFTTGDIDNAELAFNVDGSTNGNVSNFFFNEVMLVEGNKDLRWGPAPKDVENRYASLNIEVDKINAVVANKADRSYVEQRANEIGSIVANKADMSYVNQKADQWQLALTNLQIGGTNLVPLTNQGTRDLYVENKFGVASFTEKNIYGVRGILVKNTRPAPANGWFVIGKNVDLSKFKPDTDYVISFNLRGDTSIKAHAIVDVRGANSQNSISTSDPGYDLDLKDRKSVV